MATTKKMASEIVVGDVVRVKISYIRNGRFTSRSEWVTVVAVETRDEGRVGQHTTLHFEDGAQGSRPWKKYEVR